MSDVPLNRPQTLFHTAQIRNKTDVRLCRLLGLKFLTGPTDMFVVQAAEKGLIEESKKVELLDMLARFDEIQRSYDAVMPSFKQIRQWSYLADSF